MSAYGVTIAVLVGGSFIIGEGGDLFVHPRRCPRDWTMAPLRVLPVLLTSSVLLVVSGSVLLSLLGSAVLLLLCVVGSNLKLRLLNEPLVFTDLTLLAAFVKHPRFYLQAVSVPLRIICVLGAIALCFLVVCVSSQALRPRYVGGGVALLSAGFLWSILDRKSRLDGPAPALWDDVKHYGLLPTLLLYACRWFRLPPLPEKAALAPQACAPESVLVIQCESFADPTELHSTWEALPELERSRREAIQWGTLLPSGLGAYTMRSEYNILCGESDETLSYRQFDPFLTALQMTSHALPKRLRAFYQKALFVHPYDLRFYGRDRLLPSWGFTEVVGEKAFRDDDRVGPYVGDAALTRFLLDYVEKNRNFLGYCVTIENHGPWKKGRLDQQTGAEAWHHHVRHSDAMLGALREGIKASGRDIMLVFFGDHRPALEALPPVEGVERGTPYLIMRPNAPSGCQGPVTPVDITTAELHDMILRCVAPSSGARAPKPVTTGR